MEIDSSNNPYDKIEINGGFIRISFIERGWDDSPSLRIQIEESSGHLRQGPEIPIGSIGEVVKSVINILSQHH